MIGSDGNAQGCRRSPKQASPPGSDDDDHRTELMQACLSLPACLAGVIGKRKAEGEMKPTRAGAEAMPARHAMPVQKLEKACTVTQAALAPLCSGFVVLCFASSANTPVGKNRKPSRIGGHFPFEHVQPVLQSPCASLVSRLFRTHLPIAARASNLQRRRRDCNTELLATARWRPVMTLCDCRAGRRAKASHRCRILRLLFVPASPLALRLCTVWCSSSSARLRSQLSETGWLAVSPACGAFHRRERGL